MPSRARCGTLCIPGRQTPAKRGDILDEFTQDLEAKGVQYIHLGFNSATADQAVGEVLTLLMQEAYRNEAHPQTPAWRAPMAEQWPVLSPAVVPPSHPMPLLPRPSTQRPAGRAAAAALFSPAPIGT